MKLLTYRYGGDVRVGALRGGGVVDLSSLGYTSVEQLIAAGAPALQSAEAILASSMAFLPVDDVDLLSPLLAPPRIFCIGLNYRDHAAESKMDVQQVPTVFLKLQSALVGHKANIVLPTLSKEPDYEAELAVVIGKRGRNISDDWAAHIFGYTILNDVSARDVQLATSQWMLGKSFPTFCPVGPWIVTAEEVKDPHALAIRLSINGEVLQEANTRDLIFPIPALIRHISQVVTLEPGDIISTGTPHGVGLGRTPKRWLQPGEEVSIEIESIGTLTNHTVAEGSAE